MIEINVFDSEICHGVNKNILKSKIKENKWWMLNAQGKFMETKHIPGHGNIRGIFVDPQKREDTDLNSTLQNKLKEEGSHPPLLYYAQSHSAQT